MTETELIRRATAGDETAMHALYRRYAPRVYAVVRRLAGDDGLADDWAQEAWIRAFRALPKFRGDSAFSTWLHRVAVNSALQGKRRRSRHDTRETDLPDALPGGRTDSPVLRITLERALEKQAALRFQNMREMRQALDASLPKRRNATPVITLPTVSDPRPPPPRPARPTPVPASRRRWPRRR